MKSIKTVDIVNPCHQSWGSMQSKDNGRYCNNCAKTVVDFSAMSNCEIISYLTLNQQVCGRFKNHQLQDINYHLSFSQRQDASRIRKWTLAVGFLASLGYFKAKAQNDIETMQAVETSYLTTTAMPDTSKTIQISGHIKDEKGEPIIAAYVCDETGAQLALTDNDGAFSVIVPKAEKQLKINSIGFQSQQMNIQQDKMNEIVLKDEVKGEISVVIIRRPSWFSKIIKRLF